jgi:general secretion pathway protein K
MTAPRDHRGGYILVAVLSVMLLLTGFMAAGSLLVRSALHGAVVGESTLALRGLTDGGLELVAYQLFVHKLKPSLVDGRRLKFAGGTITPSIVGESGKIDLNGADPKLLAGLFASAGLDANAVAALVTHIVAMRGANPKPGPGAPRDPLLTGVPVQGLDGSGAPSAPNAAPAAMQRRRGYQSVDQLRDTPDLPRSDFKRLAPFLTVYNPDGKVDVMSAGRAVLSAIPGLSRPDIDLLLAHRGAGLPDAILPLVQNAAAYVKATPGPAYDVRIEATSASGETRAIEVVVAASKSREAPYLVLDWRDGA